MIFLGRKAVSELERSSAKGRNAAPREELRSEHRRQTVSITLADIGRLSQSRCAQSSRHGSIRDSSRSSRVVSRLLLFRLIFDAVQLMSPEILDAAVSIIGTKTWVAGRLLL